MCIRDSIIGDVEMGRDCSIWYNAVIRGDVHYIKLGNKVNVQDNVMLHCTYEKFPLNIGNNVSIGHNACVPVSYTHLDVYKRQLFCKYVSQEHRDTKTVANQNFLVIFL